MSATAKKGGKRKGTKKSGKKGAHRRPKKSAKAKKTSVTAAQIQTISGRVGKNFAGVPGSAEFKRAVKRTAGAALKRAKGKGEAAKVVRGVGNKVAPAKRMPSKGKGRKKGKKA